MNNTWIKTGLLTVALLAGSFAGANQATAQTRTSDMALTVTANNIGIFNCSLGAASYDFGNVDSDGTGGGVRNGADDAAIYTATAAVSWTCKAAPSSTVSIALTSTGASFSGTGGMDADDLSVQIPTAGGGTSTAYQTFTSGADLITGMSVGNGASAVTGDVDLQLTVRDAADVGANTWVVNLRATGSP